MKQYDTFRLTKDLNPIISNGMIGTILEVYDKENIEVEFVISDGCNYEFDDQATFTINSNTIELLN